jgi:hypothetical protein
VKAAALVVAVIIAAPTWARAGDADAKAGLIAEVSAALAEGRNGDAYARVAELLALAPADPEALLVAAQAAVATGRPGEARVHLDAAVLAAPENVDVRVTRSIVRFTAGDEAGAREDADRAIALAPDHPGAQANLAQLALFDRARRRRAGEDPGLPPGSAAELVDQLCAAAARGAGNLVLEPYFDLELVAHLPAEEQNRRSLRGIVEGVRRAGTKDPDIELVGWWVVPEVEVVGDRSWVTVQIPVIATVTARQRAKVEAALADPVRMSLLDPGVRSMLEGVPASDRLAMVDRMMGTSQSGMMELAFEVVAREDGLRVADIIRGDQSLRAALPTFKELVGAPDDDVAQEEVPAALRRPRLPIPLYVAVGALLAAIATVVILVRRRR